jgi:hypothetical protein
MNHEHHSFTGAWRLITFEFRKDNGVVIYPFGEKAEGLIIYTESGHYSAQLMRSDRPRLTAGDQMKGSAEESEANFKGCISYFGTYSVDLENSIIIHRVEGSLFPNMEGSDQKRFFRISGNSLQLTTPPIKLDGEKVVGVLQWERVG